MSETPSVILVVDDDPIVRRALARMLRGEWEVKEAGSARDAEELLASADIRIDLLLTDVILPIGNGCELAAAARVHRPTMRVVYMSGYGPEILTKFGEDPQRSAFVPKPVDAEALRAKIREQFIGVVKRQS